MRRIGTVSSESHARRFGDHLLAGGIHSSVELGDDGYAIWVHDDDRLDEAGSMLRQFLLEPDHERYRAADRQARQIRSSRQDRARRWERNYVDVRTSWGGGYISSTSRWPLTLLLGVLCIGVAVLTRLGDARQFVGWFLFYFQWPAVDTLLSQPWRLISPMLLHFGVMHLLFNLLWLMDVGRMVEARRGTGFMLLFVLLSSVLCNVAQFAWNGPFFGGMSGVGYALFGYAWMKSRYEPHRQIRVLPNTVLYMMTWFWLCVVGIIPGVANAAHAAGLVFGLAVALLPRWIRRLRRG